MKLWKSAVVVASIGLAVGVVVLDRRGYLESPAPPSRYSPPAAVAGPPEDAFPLAVASTSVAPAPSITPALEAALSPAPLPSDVLILPPTAITITTDPGLGIALRSDCADEARTGDGWPEGQLVQLLEVGSGLCAGWTLVEAEGVQSWVRDEFLSP